jgi:hypothetical protein
MADPGIMLAHVLASITEARECLLCDSRFSMTFMSAKFPIEAVSIDGIYGFFATIFVLTP